MSNVFIEDLEQIGTIATGDVLAIDDISEPEGSKTKKISMAQLDARFLVFNPTATPIGEMFQTDNTVATAIAVIDEWVQIGNFLAGELQSTTFAANQLTVAKAGEYLLTCSMDAIGVAIQTREFEFVVRVNGTPVLKTKRARGLSNSASGAFPLSGILPLAVDDVVDIAVRNTETTDNLTILNANLTVHGI